ncbi:hypothetical protein GOP47_0025138 [Adiantum capillus-veneris]|uniref:Pre-mRNA-splicing factor 18 n=1 Tax=Adiantum capillus-veneris TaxID=13818 RepID=A0A9D4U3E0_ADICA|nr:hypothetical protein GOP47_0025138 [Adiantum capillus-veneris]
MRSLEVGEGLGPRKYVRRRIDQPDRKTLYRPQELSHVKCPSLPHVAGIITSLSALYPYPASLVPQPKPSKSPADEKRIDELIIHRDDVMHQLHHWFRQPITLFGEDDDARLLRYKNLLKSGCHPVDSNKDEDPYTDEYRNDLSLDLVDFKKSDKFSFLHRDVKNKKKVVDDVDDAFGTCNGGDAVPGEGAEGMLPDLELDADHKYMTTHFDALCDEEKILVFFRQLLIEWERELQKRPESEKRTDKGRSNAATLAQCAQNLAPLVRRCKKRMLPLDMRQALVCIVTNCLQRDYVAAMDQFIKLAIYYAPCPIGITILDSHERAVRERISANAGAQASANEITHKVLQSVKRLMTLCQRRYPAVLSKLVQCNGVCNGNGTQSHLQQEVGNLIT